MRPPRDADRLFARPIVEYLGHFSGLSPEARRELQAMDDEDVVRYMRRAPSGSESDGHGLLRNMILGSASELLAWRVVERARLQRGSAPPI